MRWVERAGQQKSWRRKDFLYSKDFLAGTTSILRYYNSKARKSEGEHANFR